MRHLTTTIYLNVCGFKSWLVAPHNPNQRSSEERVYSCSGEATGVPLWSRNPASSHFYSRESGWFLTSISDASSTSGGGKLQKSYFHPCLGSVYWLVWEEYQHSWFIYFPIFFSYFQEFSKNPHLCVIISNIGHTAHTHNIHSHLAGSYCTRELRSQLRGFNFVHFYFEKWRLVRFMWHLREGILKNSARG